ncbi:ABC transporter permease [Oscillospiraceae bacterium MB08-C2-2]|nr:ABC transporter permease [Oscillospiraceae bacterium MB08-C2-2]
MRIIAKSIRQMLRTPVRSALFLVLIALAASLLSLGGGLYLLSSENTKRLEDVFVTIGTVRQKSTRVYERETWDAEKKEYITRGSQAEYASIVPVDVLHFEGANYIHSPVRRPYYGAYNFDWKVHNEDWSVTLIAQWRENYPVLELEPVEDCVPDHPVRMNIKKRLYFERPVDGWEGLWLCDHYNPDPLPLYAGKTYIMALDWKPEHADFPRFSGEFFPSAYDYNLREHRASPRYEEWAIASTQYRPDGERIPDSFAITAPWDEVTEGFYDTPRGLRWLEYAKSMHRAEYTIPVIPTDSTELLMSFYNGNSNVTQGRDITKEEYRTGDRVCLITQEFASLNGFSVGDQLALPLYYADYRDSAGRDFSPGDVLLGIPDHLLNAQGKCYEVFEENEYTIVGIYNEINKVTRSSGFDMPANGVVIPAASVKNSDENNILDYGPMMDYNTVFQIPNGTIGPFMEAWEKQGADDLEITFYDRGYTQLKEGLDKIKGVALALFVAGTFIATIILLFFCQMFIGKQKKRTAIERCLGMSRAQCSLSLLSGILVIALLGSIAGSSAGYFLSGRAMKLFTSQTQNERFNTEYSSWADTAHKKLDIQLGDSPADPIICVVTGSFILILSAAIAMVGIQSNLRSEPLKLLSMRET